MITVMKNLCLLLSLLLLRSCSPGEPEIYQWRGAGRSGIYPDKELLKGWPEEGPREIWWVDGIGNGFGSPVFAGERLYITGEIDSMSVLHCLDLEGKMIWQKVLGREWVKSYRGSRSAPTIVGDHIYVGSGMGNLYCLEKDSGKILWSKDFSTDFEGQYPLHGHTEAPVVSGNKVFWAPGGKEFNVVALDRYTGDLIWSNPGFSERSGYNASNLIELPHRTLYVTFSAYHLMGFDAESGEMIWSQLQDNLPPDQRKFGYGDTHPNAVIYSDGYIYYAASDGNDGVKLKLSKDGSEITEIWRNPGFDSFMGGIVKTGNFIYGTADSKKQLVAIDATSGQLTDSLKIGWGAVISADGHLYYYNQKGDLKLIEYQDGKLKEISSFKVSRGSGEHFSHPVIYKGMLYQRHGMALMAYDISFHIFALTPRPPR